MILVKIGFEQISDEIYNWYQETIEELIEVKLSEFILVKNELAAKMYDQIMYQMLINGNRNQM